MTRSAQLGPDGHRAAKIDFSDPSKTLYLKVAGILDCPTGADII